MNGTTIKIVNFLLIFFLTFSITCRKDEASESSKILKICNWEDYFGETTISDFEKATGIQVDLEFYEDEVHLVSILQSSQSDMVKAKTAKKKIIILHLIYLISLIIFFQVNQSYPGANFLGNLAMLQTVRDPLRREALPSRA